MNPELQNFLFSSEKLVRAYFETPSSPDTTHHVILASFPKSGNTWLRFVVSNVNALSMGEGEVNFASIDSFSPAIRGNRKLKDARLVDGYPLFLKTHFPFVKGFSGLPSVVIVRNPFKVIPSYYNYLQQQHAKQFSGQDEFFFHWRYGFNAWANFMRSWQDRAYIVLRYEDVQLEPLLHLASMYHSIGYQVDQAMLANAVNMSTRDKMKKSLNEFGDPHNSNGFDFVRKESESVGICDAAKERILNDSRLSPHFFDQARRYGYL